jgi:hypothetical protein
MIADESYQASTMPNLALSDIKHSARDTDRGTYRSQRSSARSMRSTRSNLASSARMQMISSRDMEDLKNTLIDQTNKIQQKTVAQIETLKERMDSEAIRRANAESELDSLRMQVRNEQMKRENAEMKTERLRRRMNINR